jgi:hypothetical protein
VIEQYLLDQPEPIEADAYSTTPTVLEDEEAILLPLPHLKFATIPSFVEALPAVGGEMGLECIASLPWEDMSEVWISHPICFPGSGTYAISTPEDDDLVSPGIPEHFRHGTFSVTPGQMTQKHILWSLWGFDVFIDVPGHRVRQIDEYRACVYTPWAVYRVMIPDYPKKLPPFAPGVFMRIPTQQLQRTNEESTPLALAV